MKSILAATLLLVSFNNFAADFIVETSTTFAYKFLRLDAQERVVLSVGKETHMSCFQRYTYEVVKKKNMIFVLQRPLAHILSVCVNPTLQTEGVDIVLKTSNSARTFELYLPAKASVELSSDQKPENPDMRICTAEAGMLFNPETSTCKGYSNGCIKNDLLELGYREAQGLECR